MLLHTTQTAISVAAVHRKLKKPIAELTAAGILISGAGRISATRAALYSAYQLPEPPPGHLPTLVEGGPERLATDKR